LGNDRVTDVEPPRLEVDVGPGLEDRADVSTNRLTLGRLAGGVVLETMSGECIEMIVSRSWAFHASL